jgi:prepilin-type N-terminal cleavage/methylation domain-containing protein
MTRDQLKCAGVTLIELLCVMAIMAILAALLLGGVSRAYNSARNKMWRMEADSFQGYIRDQLLDITRHRPITPP